MRIGHFETTNLGRSRAEAWNLSVLVFYDAESGNRLRRPIDSPRLSMLQPAICKPLVERLVVFPKRHEDGIFGIEVMGCHCTNSWWSNDRRAPEQADGLGES
jgi:hypothetical protein